MGGLSVITNIIEHNRRSTLRGRVGKEHSKDLIGDTVRDMLEENVAKFDPFNRARSTKHVFADKPCHGIFDGLSEAILDRFIENKRREYRLKYV